MKKFFWLLALAAIFFTSCNMGEDGDAYLRIKYYDSSRVNELKFVELYYDVTVEDGDQTYVDTYYKFDRRDWKLYYNKYFRIDPGYYTLYYSYEVTDKYGDVYLLDWCCEIEIWINEGRSKHRDGDDVKFDLTLYSPLHSKYTEDYIDFTHETYKHKSYNLNSKTEKFVETYSNGPYEIRCTYYPVNREN